MRNVLLAALASLLLSTTGHASAQEASPAQQGTPLRVMFIGNSLTYVNDLPRLVRALAAAQPGKPAIATSAWVAPGGSLAERWDDGHAAAALRSSHWDALVLQERGGLLACMASPESRRAPECRNSERAHREFAELAAAQGTRVLLLSTWGPGKRWQERLDDAIGMMKSKIQDTGANVSVVPAGRTLMEWSARDKGGSPAFIDGIHPSLPASLIMAGQVYRAVTGQDAQANDLRIDFPLLPANALVKADAPMEAQPQIAGDGSIVVLKAAALAPYLDVARGSK